MLQCVSELFIIAKDRNVTVRRRRGNLDLLERFLFPGSGPHRRRSARGCCPQSCAASWPIAVSRFFSDRPRLRADALAGAPVAARRARGRPRPTATASASAGTASGRARRVSRHLARLGRTRTWSTSAGRSAREDLLRACPRLDRHGHRAGELPSLRPRPAPVHAQRPDRRLSPDQAASRGPDPGRALRRAPRQHRFRGDLPAGAGQRARRGSDRRHGRDPRDRARPDAGRRDHRAAALHRPAHRRRGP